MIPYFNEKFADKIATLRDRPLLNQQSLQNTRCECDITKDHIIIANDRENFYAKCPNSSEESRLFCENYNSVINNCFFHSKLAPYLQSNVAFKNIILYKILGSQFEIDTIYFTDTLVHYGISLYMLDEYSLKELFLHSFLTTCVDERLLLEKQFQNPLHNNDFFLPKLKIRDIGPLSIPSPEYEWYLNWSYLHPHHLLTFTETGITCEIIL